MARQEYAELVGQDGLHLLTLLYAPDACRPAVDGRAGNVDYGLNLSAVAEQVRSDVFQEYDFLICPVKKVPPSDVEIDGSAEIAGVEMENYIAWMKSA